MDINKILKDNFKEVNKAYFEKDMGLDFLRVEVNERDIKVIEEISRNISSYLDEHDPKDSEYYLDVFSPGTDTEFDPKESNEHIGENVLLELNKAVKGFNSFEGELISAGQTNIVVRWNAKGQFRKQELDIDNIKNIKKYSKVKNK